MKISVFIATSLDGFIARLNGDIDWLINAGDTNDPEDYGYGKFIATVNCLVIGRNSFEKVLSFPEWPYAGKRVVVISRTLNQIPEKIAGKVELYAGPVEQLAAQLSSEGHDRIYIDGGKTIQSFLGAGLVTDMTITRIPILIGSGLPLFGELPGDIHLDHIETKAFRSGFVQSHYELRKDRISATR
jgi:dihydrofolate reductase